VRLVTGVIYKYFQKSSQIQIFVNTFIDFKSHNISNLLTCRKRDERDLQEHEFDFAVILMALFSLRVFVTSDRNSVL